jgi:toxin CptA
MRAQRLNLRLKASLLLAITLLFAHGAAIACAVVFLPGWWLSGVAAFVITASLAFHLCRDALQWSADAVTAIVLNDGGECTFVLKNGRTLTGRIELSTFVAPLLTVINIRPFERRRRRTAILLPDSATAQDLRSVRVWLRHRSLPTQPVSGAL